jgi:hypothetical protein
MKRAAASVRPLQKLDRRPQNEARPVIDYFCSFFSSGAFAGGFGAAGFAAALGGAAASGCSAIGFSAIGLASGLASGVGAAGCATAS